MPFLRPFTAWPVALFLVCLTGPMAHAATSSNLSTPGTIGLSGLKPMDGEVVSESPAAAAERIYPLGPPRRIGGALRMDDRLQVHGQLTSITWELPPDRSASATFTQARLALRGKNTQVLFWCEGRECGESNVWANDILSNTRVLGTDDQQGFLLIRQVTGDADTLVAVYCVLRGNRRVVLHAEALVPQTPLGPVLPTSGTLLRELRDAGELNFPGLVGAPQPQWVSVLSRTLILDSALRVRLGGPNAEQWQAALTAAGVRASRVGLGAADASGLRVERTQ